MMISIEEGRPDPVKLNGREQMRFECLRLAGGDPKKARELVTFVEGLVTYRDFHGVASTDELISDAFQTPEEIASRIVSLACTVGLNTTGRTAAGDPDTLRTEIAAAIYAERAGVSK